MSRLRFYPALFVGKMIYKVEKLLNKNATFFPGSMAVKLCPDILKYFEKPEKIICITGTNGKTTVTNMLISFYEKKGYKVIHNSFGSNVAGGIVTSFLYNSNFLGKCKGKDIAILEVDEKSSRLVFPYMEPDWLICTNLFRDSIKRNAHTEYIAGILDKYIPKKTKLIVNADDLISCGLAEGNERVYFGIDRQDYETESADNLVKDITICPKCDSRLVYDFARYHHIGRSHCPNCNFASPKSDYAVSKIDAAEDKVVIKGPRGNSETYTRLSENIVNIYNQVACTALLTELGFSKEDISTYLTKDSIVASRFSVVEANGTKIMTQLSKGKNSIACSRALDYINHYEADSKSVLVMVDDLYEEKEGSENTCWLYDADFEYLAVPEVKRVVVAGARALDHRIRLLMAGIPEDRIVTVESELDAVDKLAEVKTEAVFILHEVFGYNRASEVRNRLRERLVGKNA
ncbi:MAG: DUF1727 domain-containing protein [Lachnospiraceae bacterium]|nr:DUF1727 domain-containing protein [Lachnospiraceae bacterium]